MGFYLRRVESKPNHTAKHEMILVVVQRDTDFSFSVIGALSFVTSACFFALKPGNSDLSHGLDFSVDCGKN